MKCLTHHNVTGDVMKVSIETTKGSFVFGGGFVVKVQVNFSPEEIAILDKQRLWKTVIYEYEEIRGSTPINFVVTIAKIRNAERRFKTAVDAANFEHELKADHPPRVKSFIEDSGEASKAVGGKDEFEL
jgi:hypothetical protein